MLSKNQRKHIRQLSQKKYRQQTGMFVAEGEKVVRELLDAGWNADSIYSSSPLKDISTTNVDQSELERISHFTSASRVLSIFHLPKIKTPKINYSQFSLVLEGVSDPGNLGTIIRLCDWYGIEDIYCSPNSVDCFNPKVVQSTMGSITRVSCHYLDLATLIDGFKGEVFAATLAGTAHYELTFPKSGLLVMGSESRGISSELLDKIENKVTIPRGMDGEGPESLNVANATAILLSEIFRP